MKIRMKQLRAIKGWTQSQTAIELGMSLDYVKSVEAGRRTPSLQMAKRISQLFGCDCIDEIIEAS